MRVAFATCAAMPDGWLDDHPAAELLGAEYRVWDDPGVDWAAYDRVVLRSVWDYSWRLDQFLAWCESVGHARLRNTPDLVSFNADKSYLGAIEAPTVPTAFVPRGTPSPDFDGEVVVKPSISAGARDTGRFATVAAARGLIDHIHATGRVALVQPYLASVADRGETELVYLGGELSHILRKRLVLEDLGVPPLADGPIPVARVMLEEDLVVAGTAGPAELAAGDAVHAEVAARFGVPLYARIDLVTGDDGRPLVSEVEMIEPCLYLATAAGAAERFAAAVRRS